MRHTDSVCYLPYNSKACEVAATLPGQAYVWRSSPTSDTQAEELTQNYYTQIVEGVNKLDVRLDELKECWPALTLGARKQKNELLH